MRSLSSRLWILWVLTLAASAGVALLLVQLVRTSTAAEVGRAQAVVAGACDAIRDRYAFYVTGWNGDGAATADPNLGQTLVPVVAAALARQPGIEGGIWSAEAGSLTYAFPTYEGTGVKTDFPRAELPGIRAVNLAVATSEQPVLRRSSFGTHTLLLAACPLPGPIDGLSAWTMARVQRSGDDSLRTGLGLLLALVLGIAGWVTWLTAGWGRRIRTIETALASHDLEELPSLPLSGERELDRIVTALNDAGERLSLARARSAAMAAQVTAAERLAALGRLAAGVAHEVRNPMAAMRLRAENALAGDPARCRPALEDSIGQIARIDRLLAEMLAMARRSPDRQEVDVASFLSSLADEHRERAEAAGLRLVVGSRARPARFDPELIRRALDNLIRNATEHTGPGGQVCIRADDLADGLRITVTDSGSGVDPAIRPRLFEPFATSRPEGTGLGLAIAREMAECHGGHLHLVEGGGPLEPGGAGQGAAFALILPRSPCPPS